MAIEWNISPVMGGECSFRSVDQLIASLAAAQHGVVARAQLGALGVGDDAVDHRLARGRLHPVHRGVFSVGHRGVPTREATWMAAVLAAGPDAVLAFRAAGALWRIRNSDRIEVICPRKLRRPEIEVHRIALAPDEIAVVRGIAVTTPARTPFDLAAVVAFHQLEAAFNEAESSGSPARPPSTPSSRATADGAGPGRSAASSNTTDATARRAPAASSNAC